MPNEKTGIFDIYESISFERISSPIARRLFDRCTQRVIIDGQKCPNDGHTCAFGVGHITHERMSIAQVTNLTITCDQINNSDSLPDIEVDPQKLLFTDSPFFFEFLCIKRQTHDPQQSVSPDKWSTNNQDALFLKIQRHLDDLPG
jgi:hypothetical protein